ncbi:electron transporter SenC [Altererythrobacter sp. B11]|uniref:SCO family protein n=1 Tax=Altererythrobacter sp. B11 TaxID=2060312 RepID=UPI000DC7073B|nr:SCO family protein [Altererythrobacter sp. B11]BBC72061.1 electron transporter SenC [Altererythrobacter sp. B11]
MIDAGAKSRLGKLRLVLWAGVFLVAGIALSLWFTGSRPAAEQATDYGDSVGGPFEMVASDGSTVTDKTLAGKPYAIFFGFTRCPDVCPTTLARMARLRQELGPDGEKFRLVFVSVDPEHDKPEDVGRYVDLFATPILGLTGSERQLAQIVKAYHVYYQKVPEGDDYTIDHSAGVYLMDAKGKLRSMIDYQEDDEAALAKLRNLIA